PRLLEDALDARGAGALGLAPARVDQHLLPAARAAQVALPGALDAGDADPVALDVARAAQRREPVAVALGHVPEHVLADLLERVVAHGDGHDLDADELRLVGLEVRHGVPG